MDGNGQARWPRYMPDNDAVYTRGDSLYGPLHSLDGITWIEGVVSGAFRRRWKRLCNAAEDQMCGFVRSLGLIPLKRGWPDFSALDKQGNLICVVEVKSKDLDPLSREQHALLKALALHGILAFRWSPGGGFVRIGGDGLSARISNEEVFDLMPDSVRDGWREYWADVRRRRAETLATGEVILRKAQNRIQVMCPYSVQFIARAKPLGGKWRPRSQSWSFPYFSLPLIRELLYELFGETKVHDTIPAKKAKL